MKTGVAILAAMVARRVGDARILGVVGWLCLTHCTELASRD